MTVLVKMCYKLTNVSYYLYYDMQKQRKFVAQVHSFLFPDRSNSSLFYLSSFCGLTYTCSDFFSLWKEGPGSPRKPHVNCVADWKSGRFPQRSSLET